MARHHGLSILGGDILSSYDMIMPSANYDRMMKETVELAKRKVITMSVSDFQYDLNFPQFDNHSIIPTLIESSRL